MKILKLSKIFQDVSIMEILKVVIFVIKSIGKLLDEDMEATIMLSNIA